MGRPGFEPGTNNLKGCCSTIELSTPVHCEGALDESMADVGKGFLPEVWTSRLTERPKNRLLGSLDDLIAAFVTSGGRFFSGAF